MFWDLLVRVPYLGLLHFSQTLPSALDLTQQGCAQSLPAAFAFSQQVSAYEVAVTRAMTPARMSFVMFKGRSGYKAALFRQALFH